MAMNMSAQVMALAEIEKLLDALDKLTPSDSKG